MNHKASATCRNGHTFEFGECRAQKQRLFGGTKPCGSKAFEQLYADGSALTVSFDDRPWEAVRCIGCKTLYKTTKCPHCDDQVPVHAFKKKGIFAKLG